MKNGIMFDYVLGCKVPIKLYHGCGKRLIELEEMEIWPDNYICPFCRNIVDPWETKEEL